ncbi:MAG: DUF2442 domain-containing protein [Melioribacteraceae bacterium]|nr:DUF2442 domain-containing protein [Melioribacteraceae bacterium]
MSRIIEITVLGDYQLHLKFDDGIEGELKLNHLLKNNEYNFVNDYSEFSKIKVHPKSGDLFWEDYQTEHLCKNAIRKQIELRNLAKRLKLMVD